MLHRQRPGLINLVNLKTLLSLCLTLFRSTWNGLGSFIWTYLKHTPCLTTWAIKNRFFFRSRSRSRHSISTALISSKVAVYLVWKVQIYFIALSNITHVTKLSKCNFTASCILSTEMYCILFNHPNQYSYNSTSVVTPPLSSFTKEKAFQMFYIKSTSSPDSNKYEVPLVMFLYDLRVTCGLARYL